MRDLVNALLLQIEIVQNRRALLCAKYLYVSLLVR